MSGLDSDNYGDLTNEQFDWIVRDICEEHGVNFMLTIPGVYEVVSKELNEEVLKRWELIKEQKRRYEASRDRAARWLEKLTGTGLPHGDW